MASTVLGGRSRDRVTNTGHGTEALGPGDTTEHIVDVPLEQPEGESGERAR
jgi:hypothetical protein